MMRSTSYTLSGSSVARCRFFVVLGVVVGIGLARTAGVFRRFEEDDEEEEGEEEEEEEEEEEGELELVSRRSIAAMRFLLRAICSCSVRSSLSSQFAVPALDDLNISTVFDFPTFPVVMDLC